MKHVVPPHIRAIDICSGAGGWACAARGLPIHIVAAFDLWEAAAKTYEINHPQTRVILQDLRDTKAVTKHLKSLGKEPIDLILGGIPCEWISTCRHLQKVKAKELADQRATLDSCLAIVKKLDPRWWCLEDVIALEDHLPPLTPFSRIDAKHFSAQRRKRVFVGHFPLPLNARSKLVMRDKLRAGPYRIGRRTWGRTPQLQRTFTNTTTLAAYPDRKAPTILNFGSQRDAKMAIVDPTLASGMRQIEWQEAAVLQGFPEDYCFYGSPSDVTRQVGRAIQIDLGRAILQRICEEWRKGQ